MSAMSDLSSNLSSDISTDRLEPTAPVHDRTGYPGREEPSRSRPKPSASPSQTTPPDADPEKPHHEVDSLA
jgi:hypothetical protein